MALLFMIAVYGFCLAMLLAMAHTLISLWHNEHRMPPRLPGFAPALVPVDTEDRRTQGMSYVGRERRRARQAALEAARKRA